MTNCAGCQKLGTMTGKAQSLIIKCTTQHLHPQDINTTTCDQWQKKS